MKATILRSTIAKQSTVQAKELAPEFKIELEPGAYSILKWSYAASSHVKVTFPQPIAGYQTWLIWGDDVECDGEKRTINLKVPYYTQRNNAIGSGVTCSSSTHAMILNYLKPGSVASDDEYFQKYVQTLENSTNWDIHTAAFQEFGLKSVFRQNLDYEDLYQSLTLGLPVAIGVLHKGHISAPGGGHVLAIVGVNESQNIFYANDPWGMGFDYTDFNGEGIEYPTHPSLDHRWLADGANSGWGRIITEIDGKPTGLA